MACSILLFPIHEQEYAIASKSEVDSNSTSPTFVAAGDWGCTAETEKTVNNIISDRPDIVLALGDLSYEKIADCWLDIISPIKNKTRITIGNHDVISPSLVQQYLNEFGLGKQYYSFDYQSIHFVSMSAEVPFDKNSEQFLFITRDLASAASNPEIKWIIVFFHEPMYISPAVKSVAMNNDFRGIYHPLFSKYQVDLVLAGHNHNYERSYPIKYNSEEPSEPIITSVNKTIYDNPDGQIFIVAGTAGRSLYKFFGQAPYISTQYIGHGLAYFHLSDANTVLSARFYSDDGVVKDKFSIKKTPNS
jgi:hypothetical protein